MIYTAGDFFQVPNRRILHTFSAQAQLVYMWICEKANYDTGQCSVSIRTIAKLSNKSSKTIMAALDELTSRGVLSVVKGDRITKNKYQLHTVEVVSGENTGGIQGKQGVVSGENISILKDNTKIAEGKSSAVNNSKVEKKKLTTDEYNEQLLVDKQDYVRLIGVYITILKEDYDMAH